MIMSQNKRLFLFAGYTTNGIINNALIYYVSALSKFGDVVICMDCDCAKSEINKLKPFSIYQIIGRHKEYDFGSYKRAYQYARDNDLLKNYEYVYLVNDSVFGPMFNMSKLMYEIEHISKDAVGIIESKHKTHTFMESWFVRLNKKIFMSTWFDKFLSSVQTEPDKTTITIKYEHGLTNLIEQHKCSWTCIYTIYGRETYNRPKDLFQQGCPFIKKASFTRHNGALGNQIKYILNHSNKDATDCVLKTANQLYGEKYMEHFLTSNLIHISWRNITYGIKKLINGEI